MGCQPRSVCCSKHVPMPISDALVVNAMVEFGSGWANVADADREHFAALNAVCISYVQLCLLVGAFDSLVQWFRHSGYLCSAVIGGSRHRCGVIWLTTQEDAVSF